jgi:uncharacterized OB-fold protein
MSETLPAFPAVGRDSASTAFFDAAARGELLVQQCGTCATVLPPEARTCHACGSAELGPTVVSGLGSLVSWAVVRQAPIPALAGAVPYVTAVVELNEGPWLMVRLIDVDPEALTAGDRVRADFVRSGTGEITGEMLPVFRQVADGASEERA